MLQAKPATEPNCPPCVKGCKCEKKCGCDSGGAVVVPSTLVPPAPSTRSSAPVGSVLRPGTSAAGATPGVLTPLGMAPLPTGTVVPGLSVSPAPGLLGGATSRAREGIGGVSGWTLVPGSEQFGGGRLGQVVAAAGPGGGGGLLDRSSAPAGMPGGLQTAWFRPLQHSDAPPPPPEATRRGDDADALRTRTRIEERNTPSTAKKGAPGSLKSAGSERKALDAQFSTDTARSRVDAKLAEMQRQGAYMPDASAAPFVQSLAGVKGVDLKQSNADPLASPVIQSGFTKGAEAAVAASKSAHATFETTGLESFRAREDSAALAKSIEDYTTAVAGAGAASPPRNSSASAAPALFGVGGVSAATTATRPEPVSGGDFGVGSSAADAASGGTESLFGLGGAAPGASSRVAPGPNSSTRFEIEHTALVPGGGTTYLNLPTLTPGPSLPHDVPIPPQGGRSPPTVRGRGAARSTRVEASRGTARRTRGILEQREPGGPSVALAPPSVATTVSMRERLSGRSTAAALPIGTSTPSVPQLGDPDFGRGIGFVARAGASPESVPVAAASPDRTTSIAAPPGMVASGGAPGVRGGPIGAPTGEVEGRPMGSVAAAPAGTFGVGTNELPAALASPGRPAVDLAPDNAADEPVDADPGRRSRFDFSLAGGASQGAADRLIGRGPSAFDEIASEGLKGKATRDPLVGYSLSTGPMAEQREWDRIYRQLEADSSITPSGRRVAVPGSH